MRENLSLFQNWNEMIISRVIFTKHSNKFVDVQQNILIVILDKNGCCILEKIIMFYVFNILIKNNNKKIKAQQGT